MRLVFLFWMLFVCASLFAQSAPAISPSAHQFELDNSKTENADFENQDVNKKAPARKKKRKRAKIRKGVAALLALLLGPFGVHRLYLGTSDTVPIFYTLTLGGLMILPLVDIFVMLFSKNFDALIGNKSVIMW